MRTGLRVTLIVIAVLAALVFLLVATPVGWRLTAGLIEGAASDATGLEVAVGSLRGNLLRNATLEDVRLAAPEGPTVFTAGKMEAHYRLGSLLKGNIVVPRLRVEDAELFYVIGPDGEPVGWSELLGRGDGPEAPADTLAEPPVVDVAVEFVDWHVVVADTGAGYALDVAGLGLTARGGPAAFEVAVRGSLLFEARELEGPVAGAFGARLSGGGETVTVEMLRLGTNVVDLAARGRLERAGEGDGEAGDGLRLSVATEVAVDLTEAAAVSGIQDLSGSLEITISSEGPVTAPTYEGELRSEELSFAGVDVADLTASLVGDTRRLEVVSLSADVLGAPLDALGTFVFPLADSADGPGSPGSFAVRAAASGLDLSRVASLAPEDPADVGGLLDLTLDLFSSTLSPADLSGTLHGTVAGLRVGEILLGAVDLAGEADGGSLTIEGGCCGTEFGGDVELLAYGFGPIDFFVDADELSRPGAVFGLPDLRGSAAAIGTIVAEAGSVSVYAVSQDLRVGDFDAGPVAIDARGAGGTYRATFSALGGALRGRGRIADMTRYALTADVSGLDLETVVSDSLADAMDLGGTVSAGVTADGVVGGRYAVEAEVTDLLVEARGQSLELVAPFFVDAGPDSIALTEVSLDGTMGSFTAAGGFDYEETVDLVARFEALDLEAMAALLPEPPAVTPRGIVDGRFSLRGKVDDPVFQADVDIRQFSVRGISLNAVTLEAESDRSDLTFTLFGDGPTAGSIATYGSVPIVPDSLTFLAVDPTREFGISVLCDSLVIDAGDEFLPGIRGRKRIAASGSALLVGRSDSLSTVYGRGSFESARLEFDPVEFRLASPVNFDLAGGAVEIDTLGVDIEKRRVLGSPAGGRIEVSAVIGYGAESMLDVSASNVDVGHLLRAFARELGPVLRGSLSLDASFAGELDALEGEYSWVVEEPLVYGVGLDRLGGRGVVADGEIRIESAGIAAGDGTIVLSGTVALPGNAPRAAAGTVSRPVAPADEPDLDLRVKSNSFTLGGLGKLPSEIDRLEGSLDIDLAITGRASAPSMDGTLALTGGRLEGYDLVEPVTDIELRITAAERAFAITGGSARMGSGGFEVAGFAELGGEERPTAFQLTADINSPRVAVRGAFDSRIRGNVSWVGSTEGSRLSGEAAIERMEVTYSFGLADFLGQRSAVIVIEETETPAANVQLDLDVNIDDRVEVDSRAARLTLRGSVHVGGTLAQPQPSGGVYAEEGSFRYMDHEFTLDRLNVSFIDPRRPDPFLDLFGTVEVEDRSETNYYVTLEFRDYLMDGTPELKSVPDLTAPDIVALLTFGDTFGTLFETGDLAGASSDAFGDVVRRTFTASVFGIAESALERTFHLDRVKFDDDAITDQGLMESDVTLGKKIGDDFRVDYTTSVGNLGVRRIELSARLTERLWLTTRADPAGNNAVELRFRPTFR